MIFFLHSRMVKKLNNHTIQYQGIPWRQMCAMHESMKWMWIQSLFWACKFLRLKSCKDNVTSVTWLQCAFSTCFLITVNHRDLSSIQLEPLWASGRTASLMKRGRGGDGTRGRTQEDKQKRKSFSASHKQNGRIQRGKKENMRKASKPHWKNYMQKCSGHILL